jgi:AcrR family transcriptional regulator
MGRNQSFVEAEALKTIASLLAKINPDALGMDAIIKATGIQRQSIYRTWGSKSGLIASAIKYASENASEKDLIAILALTLGSESALDKPILNSLNSLINQMNKEHSNHNLQTSIGKHLTSRIGKNK